MNPIITLLAAEPSSDGSWAPLPLDYQVHTWNSATGYSIVKDADHYAAQRHLVETPMSYSAVITICLFLIVALLAVIHLVWDFIPQVPLPRRPPLRWAALRFRKSCRRRR